MDLQGKDKKLDSINKQDLVEVKRHGTWNTNFEQLYLLEFIGAKNYSDVRFAKEGTSYVNSLFIRYSVDDFFKENGFKTVKVVDLSHDGEYPPSFSNIEYEPKKHKSCLHVGYLFLEKGDHKYVFNIDYGAQEVIFRLTSLKDATPNSQQILQDLLNYSDKNNFLKGKKIDAKCNFITFDKKYTWNDLILDEARANDVRKNLSNLIDHRDIYRKNKITIKRGLIFSGPPGCQPKGSKVLMKDGTFKNVEDVIVGDEVWSPQKDGTTIVSKVTSLKDYISNIYQVSSKLGEYYCAAEHIVVSDSIIRTKRHGKRKSKHVITELQAKDYDNLPKEVLAHSKLFRSSAIPYEKSKLDIDPYLMGVLLGDGSFVSGCNGSVTTLEPEIIKYLESVAKKFGYILSRNDITYHLTSKTPLLRRSNGTFRSNNFFLKVIEKLGLRHKKSGTKFIPNCYKYSSVSQRLSLLAGLLDTDGHWSKRDHVYEYTTKSGELAIDIYNVSCSLGFRTTVNEKYIVYKGEARCYYRLIISPQKLTIPVLCKRKKHTVRNISWKNGLNSQITVENLKLEDKVYGFTLDSKSGWYITDNYLVTHNTGKTLLGKILCNTIDWTFIWVTPKHLEESRDVSRIIGMARDLAPSVIFLEDIDLYGGDRASNSRRDILGELMNQLDGVQENHDIITIATTNHVEVLEKALLQRPGRFDKVIEFDEPKSKSRVRMLKQFSEGLNLDSDVNFEDFADISSKLTGAQIKELVNMAVLQAIDTKSFGADGILTIKKEHFTAALPAVKQKDHSVGFLRDPDDDCDVTEEQPWDPHQPRFPR